MRNKFLRKAVFRNRTTNFVRPSKGNKNSLSAGVPLREGTLVVTTDNTLGGMGLIMITQDVHANFDINGTIGLQSIIAEVDSEIDVGLMPGEVAPYSGEMLVETDGRMSYGYSSSSYGQISPDTLNGTAITLLSTESSGNIIQLGFNKNVNIGSNNILFTIDNLLPVMLSWNSGYYEVDSQTIRDYIVSKNNSTVSVKLELQ